MWSLVTARYKGSHYAVMPERLAETPILFTSRPGDVVLDPFMGSGTTAVVAVRHGRQWIGCDIDERNIELINERLEKVKP